MKNNKQNTLKINWSKKEKAVMYHHPSGNQTATDSQYLHQKLGMPTYKAHCFDPEPSFLAELEERGYDLTTIIFSICKKEGHKRWEND